MMRVRHSSFADIPSLLHDPDFNEPYTVMRSSGRYVQGHYQPNQQAIKMTGTVQPIGAEALQKLPEGEREQVSLIFKCTQPLYVSQGMPNADGTQNISDEIIWNGSRYKIVRVDDWSSYGFMSAYGQKLGDEM